MIISTSSQVAIHKLLKRRELDSRTLLHFQQNVPMAQQIKAERAKGECLLAIPQNKRESTNLLVKAI
jgi:hypothetical protein